MEMLKEGEQYSIETTFRASRFTICLVTLKSLNPWRVAGFQGIQ